MAAFHIKLADFLFLLWIKDFIKTVFCHKQEAHGTASCENSECLQVYSYMLVIAVQSERFFCLSQLRDEFLMPVKSMFFPVFHLKNIYLYGGNVMYF